MEGGDEDLIAYGMKVKRGVNVWREEDERGKNKLNMREALIALTSQAFYLVSFYFLFAFPFVLNWTIHLKTFSLKTTLHA